MISRQLSGTAPILAALTVSLCFAGCERRLPGEGMDPQPAATRLVGAITVDGSSTALPLGQTVAAAFHQMHAGVDVHVGASSTSDGFNKLCAGQIDVATASRPINAAEIEACKKRGIDYIELPVAFDSLSVVVSASNTVVSCLTVGELKRMWEPAAEGRVTRWSDIRQEFPPQPLSLFGPGNTSGTFDYFTLAIVGLQGRSRTDYTKSDDDSLLANDVAGDRNALGYFGYTYYLANHASLKTVGIDSGRGCVTPSAKTVMDETYQPLSRPVFFYVSTKALDKPEVDAFARFAVSRDRDASIERLGYLPLPSVTLLTMSKHLDTRVKGSIFGGRGAVLGVTANSFVEEERVKNALVR